MPLQPTLNPEGFASAARAASRPASRWAGWVRGGFAAVAMLTLAGCTRVQLVDKTVLAPNVQEATLDQLLSKMKAEYDGVQTLNLSVNLTATEGGARKGEIKTYPTFAGYIFFRKPKDLRVLMLAPFVRSRALDMVANGKKFELYLPTRNTAVEGPDDVPKNPLKGFDNLRPYVIRDPLVIPPVDPGQYVTLTENSRLIPSTHGRKEVIEEPDYDLSVLRTKPDESNPAVGVRELNRVRVIHVSRVTLLPYEQDLYDDQGRVELSVTYQRYKHYGTIDYPTSLLIKVPQQELSLQLDITKLALNEKLDDEQFKLTIPAGVPVRTMQ